MTPAQFRATRKRLGLTQAELAAIFGTGARTIAAIEAGTTPKARLYELALRGLQVERMMDA
jgi:transcriptional regulator with XRE-family HTH domain